MFRFWVFAAACSWLLVLGCESSPAPPPAAESGLPESSEPSPAEATSATSLPAAKSPTTPTSIQGPLTEAESSLRGLAERLVVSDGQGGWRIAEQPATELEKLGPRAAADLWPLMRDESAPVRRGAAF